MAQGKQPMPLVFSSVSHNGDSTDAISRLCDLDCVNKDIGIGISP